MLDGRSLKIKRRAGNAKPDFIAQHVKSLADNTEKGMYGNLAAIDHTIQ